MGSVRDDRGSSTILFNRTHPVSDPSPRDELDQDA
jgi:hypothetical protein